MVARANRPRTRELPLTMPARVLPSATLMSQSNTVMGAMERLEPRRRQAKRPTTAIEPMTMGWRMPAFT